VNIARVLILLVIQFTEHALREHLREADDDLARVIANGLQASAMPYFRDLLTGGEVGESVCLGVRESGSAERAFVYRLCSCAT